MAGFLGLFGSSNSEANGNPEAFFLDDDQAKTMGNIDYMRTAKTVKRTFPKTVSQPDNKAFIQKVSATEAKAGIQPPTETSSFESNGSVTSNGVASSQRRNVDTSLDMFRSMAKQIRK
jgi:hypothetical protein